MTHLLRSLIRETLLLEEVYGSQAVVYHGTKADPEILIQAILNDEFTPGKGAGAMYGKGLYTVYDIANTKTEKGDYGDHVIKLKLNLYGYIIFDPEIALKVYKRPLAPSEQAKEVGYSKTVIAALKSVKLPRNGFFTSSSALSVYKNLRYEVKGLVFTGENDGRVAVVYDPTTAVPMAWKRVAQNTKPVSGPWIPVDKAKLLAPLHRPDISAKEGRPVQQSALRRSATGDFEAGKWDPLTALKRLEKLPEDKRVVKGSLNLSGEPITSLPQGLKVSNHLNLSNTKITALPAGLSVGGNLDLSNASIASLPAGFRVGGLIIRDSPMTSLPADLKVDGSFTLRNTPITAIPAGLKVGGSFILWKVPITALPAGLEVGGSLDLWEMPITALPAGLKVRGNIDIANTKIVSLPADLEVDKEIYGLNRVYWENVPEHLKGKLR